MNYWAIAYEDGSSYGVECVDVKFYEHYMMFVGDDDLPQEIIPYANVKVATRISQEDYVSILEMISNQEEDDG